MSLSEIVLLLKKGMYTEAMRLLEAAAADERKHPMERAEYCEWLAELYTKLGDSESAGEWYLNAVKVILSQNVEWPKKAKQALPYSEKALECFKEGGDKVSVIEAVKLKQRLIELSEHLQ